MGVKYEPALVKSFLGRYHRDCAPVAQRIEHRPPEPGAGVRVAPGACHLQFGQVSKKPSGRFSFFLMYSNCFSGAK